nr:retrovirus-related Pol polyprotein from transposon TNT 1-94 [Tanacetum cinerariifolium]
MTMRFGKWMSNLPSSMNISMKRLDMSSKSAKQSIFATSSAEAEYIAAFDASKKAVWVRKFIFGLSVVPIIEEPISMYYDNTRAIAIAN